MTLMTAQGKQPRTRAQIMGVIHTVMIIAPMVITVPLGWLLVELGVNWIVSVVIALVYGPLASFTFLAMSAVLAMDGRPTSARAPRSPVLYVVGLVLLNLMWLVVLPLVFVVLAPIGLVVRLRKSD
jgi:hypothetical protein